MSLSSYGVIVFFFELRNSVRHLFIHYNFFMIIVICFLLFRFLVVHTSFTGVSV